MQVASVALLLVLPQLAGFVVSRRWRRGFTWPLAAIATFCPGWYSLLWARARAIAEGETARGHYVCGEWMVAMVAILIAGVTVHLVAGALFAWLDHRARRLFGRSADRPG